MNIGENAISDFYNGSAGWRPAHMAADPIASLRDKFEVEDDRDVCAEMLGEEAPKAWILGCKKCDARWRLERRLDGTVSVGNVLSLLNHYASHAAKRRSA